MRIRIPSKKVCERFFLIYELDGCQKAVNFLIHYCRVRGMKIVVDGRKVNRRWAAQYYQNKAYVSKRGLNKRYVLHEFYHHLVDVKGWDLPSRIEEKDANHYAREFHKRRCY